MFQVSQQLRDIAQKVMDWALPIEREQVAVFYAGLENLDLAYAFAAECAVRGIEVLVRSQGDYISDARLLEAPIETFAGFPKIPQALIGVADWFIYMNGSRFDNSIYQRSELKERLVEIQNISKWNACKLQQLCLEKKTHLVGFLDPCLQQAQALGKSFEETRRLFLASLDIDYEKLTELGQRLIAIMERGGEIHVKCPRGTDLTLRADGRSWINDDGKSSVIPYLHNLPVGEVFVAPLETSAFGVVYPRDLPGDTTTGFRLEFNGEEKAKVSAERMFELAKPRLESATGNPYSIAEFAIGTNPCGNMLLATEKAYGTCHVALGENTWLGGSNESSLHWDFLIDKPTVTINKKPILKNGKFMT